MQQRTLILILVIALGSLVRPLEAQFSLGINTGITRMSFSGDPLSGAGRFKPGPGMSSAIRVDYRFSDAFSLSLQPGYSLLRSRYEVMNDSGTAAIDSTIFNLKTLSLPLHAIVWSENGRFYVLAGLQLDYTLSFEGETTISPYSSFSSTTSYNARDYLLSMQFGAGFIIPLGKPYLSFEFRYTQGLQDLTNELFQSDSFLPRIKVTHTSLILGLHIPMGGYSEKYHVKKRAR